MPAQPVSGLVAGAHQPDLRIWAAEQEVFRGSVIIRIQFEVRRVNIDGYKLIGVIRTEARPNTAIVNLHSEPREFLSTMAWLNGGHFIPPRRRCYLFFIM